MHDEIWQVQLGNGELRSMTLEALDAAFDAGAIVGSTPVLAPGASAWSTLAAVAGLDEVAPPSAPPIVEREAPSLSPVALDASTGGLHLGAAPLPDLSELDGAALRGSGGGKWAVALGAVAVAALIGVFVLGKSVAESRAASAAANARAVVVAAPPVATPIEALPESKPVLTDEQKRKLAEADKAREDKARAKQKEAPAKRGASGPRQKGPSPFVNGGDRFDPLNGAL